MQQISWKSDDDDIKATLSNTCEMCIPYGVINTMQDMMQSNRDGVVMNVKIEPMGNTSLFADNSTVYDFTHI